MTTTLRIAAAIAVLLGTTTAAMALPKSQLKKSGLVAVECNQIMPCYGVDQNTTIRNKTRNRQYDYDAGDSRIVAHPEGCPARLFCGCGVSVKVFGKPVRNLFLAANWLKYPKTSPAPGMVAARRGHVMYILSVDGNGNATVYDPNSGGGKTRVHTRSLTGYKTVNPHGSFASN